LIDLPFPFLELRAGAQVEGTRTPAEQRGGAQVPEELKFPEHAAAFNS